MDLGCDKHGTKIKLNSFCMKPIEFIPIPDQPERSKREDSECRICKQSYDNEKEGCVCYECRKKYIRLTSSRCGALNTQATE